MEKILCAVDFSDNTQKVINYTERLAIENKAAVYLLHVSEPPSAFLGDDFGPQIARDLKAETVKKEYENLKTTFNPARTQSETAVGFGDDVDERDE